MTVLGRAGCEPFRVWNRLEMRARHVDFDRALEAEIHDPMWMLARQWQFGEFHGEDTGSAITAQVACRSRRLETVVVGGQEQVFGGGAPLEAMVEALPIDFSPSLRAHAAKNFMLRLDEAAAHLPAGARVYDRTAYRDLFRTHFAIDEPTAPSMPFDEIEAARRQPVPWAERMRGAVSRSWFDGVKLFEQLASGALPPALIAQIPPAHATVIADALAAFFEWFEALYVQPADGSSWVDDQLEYQFGASFVDAGGNRVDLAVEEYSSGKLDWYSFELTGEPVDGATTDVELQTVLPAPARFAGMPNPRWWQFEDGDFNLGDVRADATDLAKIVVAEFALVYGNNWLIVPMQQRIGTLVQVEGIVVTDVFGWKTLVSPATGSSNGVWTAWDLFSLSPRPGEETADDLLGQHLFIPPMLPEPMESPPVESVSFVRDEVANLVWGVESRVRDALGFGRDGNAAARALHEALAPPPEPAPVPTAGGVEPAELTYKLATDVPENWIPFVAVHKPKDTREIRLQRATTRREFEGSTVRIEPQTSILRSGVPGDGSAPVPYFINEEEIPRVGVVVEGSHQRARWLDGRTVVWHGRRKRPGRGEAGSGLRFDVASPPQAP